MDEEKARKALKFVEHIEEHLAEHATVSYVICKICGKTIDQIWEEEQ